jgi:peroxiredoxin family protein
VVLFATMAGIFAFTRAGWASLPGAEADARLARSGVAGFAELLEAAIELRVRLIVCDAGLKALGLSEADLDPALPGEIAGLVTFYEAVGDGSIVFI